MNKLRYLIDTIEHLAKMDRIWGLHAIICRLSKPILTHVIFDIAGNQFGFSSMISVVAIRCSEITCIRDSANEVIGAGKSSWVVEQSSLWLFFLHLKLYIGLERPIIMARGGIITLLISFLATNAYAQTDILVDPRDGKQYKTVKIGDQIWMAQNLAYANELDHRLDPRKKERIFSYGDSLALGDQYGLYYTCEAAQKACPAGWHLPTRYEYEKLLNTFSSKKEAYFELQPEGHSGFNALMVGWFYVYDNERFGEFKFMNQMTMFWTAPIGKRNSPAVVFNFLHKVAILEEKNSHGVSVRCVKDWAR